MKKNTGLHIGGLFCTNWKVYATSLIFLFIGLFWAPCFVNSQEEPSNESAMEKQDTEAPQSRENNEKIESQLDELKRTLYCYCGCDRMTYEICHCATAEHVKVEFRNALTSGETVDDIRTAYLELHGPQYSAVMPAEGINLLAYTMPGVILLVIGGVAFAMLRHSRKNKPVYRTQLETQISDELQKRVESELEKYKEEN